MSMEPERRGVAFAALAHTGLVAIVLHPLRAVVTTLVLVSILVPFLAGLGIAHGLRDQIDSALDFGCDLRVVAEQFGRPVPMPHAVAEELRGVPGVTRVVPRIVGRIAVGAERTEAMVVGIPLIGGLANLECLEGRLPHKGPRNELVLGQELARRLHLEVGSVLPPFYRSRQGDRLSEVVGTLRPDAGLGTARMILTSLDTAGHLFDQAGLVTECLVYCRPEYEERVRRAIARGASPTLARGALRPRVVGREELRGRLVGGVMRREGVFALGYVLAGTMGILLVLVTSGIGMAERRQEVGILKATGWQTEEVLLRSLVENLLIGLGGAVLSVVLVWVWLVLLRGWGIVSVYLPDHDVVPSSVPFRLTPVPVLLMTLLALVVMLSGSLWTTWRTAIAPPRAAMR